MKIPILSFILLFACSVSAQRFVEPDKMKAFNITVNYPDYTVKTQMLKEPKQFKPDVNLTYHWYTAQKIMETKGGFDGKLLHGTYRSFYLNDQLFESGEFKYGVKSGEWKNWYPDGKLKEITNWKKGRKNGSYALYSDYGKLMAKGVFKHDLLTGTFTTYDGNGNLTSKRKYKKGKEVIKTEKVKKEKTKKEKTAKDASTPAKEKKGLFGKQKGSAELKETKPKEGATAKPDKNRKENKTTEPSTSQEKKPFGSKLKALFHKKPKTDDAGKTSKKTSVST